MVKKIHWKKMQFFIVKKFHLKKLKIVKFIVKKIIVKNAIFYCKKIFTRLNKRHKKLISINYR